MSPEIDSGGAAETFFDASDTPPSSKSEEPPSSSTSHTDSSVRRRRVLSPAAKSPSHQSPISPSPANHSTNSPPPPLPDLLQTLTTIIIKTLGFQINLLLASITFPLRLLCDPRETLNRIRSSLIETLAGNSRGIFNLALRVSVGCFWSIYVLSALAGCLIFAVLIGKIVAGLAVEKPLDLAVDLSFDYTRSSPVAEVAFSRRLVPAGRILESAVSLILPESDYNRKLGVFQVRVEFLTAQGKQTASSSRPCMLQFKSTAIKNLEIFIKSGLLLTDYSSESQKITLNMGHFREPATEHTASARVFLEPRAEQKPGTGLPEIYSASMKIQSELSLVREMIWGWRRTLFVGIVIFAFNFELLLLLICCTPLILPGFSRQSRNS